MADEWDERASAEHLRVQESILDRWIGTVAAASPFWAARIEKAGLDAAQIRDLDALRSLPTIREVDLRGAGGEGSPALVLRPTEDDVKATASLRSLWRIATSVRKAGPTGRRRLILVDYKPIHLHRDGRDGGLMIAYTRRDLDTLHRAGARAARVIGLTHDDYLVSAIPPDQTLRFWGVYHLALGASILADHARAGGEPVGVAVAGFARIPATAVAVRVDEAEELADEVASAGADVRQVGTVVLVGPPPGVEQRGAIADAWRRAGTRTDLRVLAAWAPIGGRALWAECAAGDGTEIAGLHTYPDLELLETTTPNGRVATGTGDLTHTTIGWNGTALLRYQSGDLVGGLETDPCPACGRTGTRVVAPVVPGAWEPVLDVGDERVRIDLRGISRVLSRAQEVQAWRAELRPATKTLEEGYVVRVAGELADERRDELAGALAAAVGHPPRDVIRDDRPSIETRVAESGSAFEDRR